MTMLQVGVPDWIVFQQTVIPILAMGLGGLAMFGVSIAPSTGGMSACWHRKEAVRLASWRRSGAGLKLWRKRPSESRNSKSGSILPSGF
jgi:hypothetical protein